MLFDINQSSRVDFREFCFVLSLIINSEESQRIAFIFQLYDFDNDQALSKSELKFFLKANFGYLILDNETDTHDKNQLINKIMAKLFEDKKQKLKLDEFQLWMDKHFDTIKYFEIFELVPGPLKERDIIRQIMKNAGDDKNLT